MNVLPGALDYTALNVALGSAVLGVVSGVLGSFAVLRRQGLMGDALAHAALPGVCAAFLATGSKASGVLMAGAALSGWLGMSLILLVVRRTRVDMGSALAVVLTSFFGLGVVLLTLLQKRSDGAQAGLDKFLFGQAAALVSEQVATMAAIGSASLLVVVALFKELKLVSFDPEFAKGLGRNVGALSALLTGLIVAAVVVGLNTVGVVLMSAMLVAPAAAARQWTNSLAKMVLLAAAIGVASGVAGALVSVTQPGVPTGPAIILALSVIFCLSLFFGSARGLAWQDARAKAVPDA
jgi:manganese/zinc/iron transport system permease protein